jgi:hypothetical protein
MVVSFFTMIMLGIYDGKELIYRNIQGKDTIGLVEIHMKYFEKMKVKDSGFPGPPVYWLRLR